MQAYPLSKSAARHHLAPSGPSFQTAESLNPDLPLQSVSALPFQPITANAQPTRLAPNAVANNSGLAHDADNLLAALGLYSDLLSRPGVLRPEHHHYAEELRGIAQRSTRLLRHLIHRSQPETAQDVAAPPQPEHTPVDPAAVLLELEPLLRAIAAPQAAVSLKTPRCLPYANVPKEYLERILVNLVRNAAQAIEHARPRQASSPGNIRISLMAFSGDLHLTVEDDGPGIPIVAAEAFLSPSPLPKGATHGLGHRIVHELVASSGGRIAVRVGPGQGSRFVMQWPVVPTHLTDSALTDVPASLLLTGSHEVQAC